jgi:small subunit ribosomal protein S19|tara:strand:+ start:6235 stop:6630 length:396 start_codon:yes stop_codon:yes gene_type:complete
MELTKKQFTYRGKTIEELKELDVREFAKYLTSRQRRFALRQFQRIEDFINRAKTKIAKNKAIRTHLRDLIITPAMVGMKIYIYNGQKFMPVEIIGEMLGHKFGEFSPTRARIKHGKAGVGATKGTRSKSKK